MLVLASAVCNSALALPKVSENAKIQINIPADESRTCLITSDVTEQRQIFFDFLDSAENIGMCSPTEIEKLKSASEIMSVSFWGEDVGDRIRLVVLEDTTGRWITTGFGNVARYDDPYGFPLYEYNSADLMKIREWYKANVKAEQIKKKSNHGLESTGAPPPAETPETHP